MLAKREDLKRVLSEHGSVVDGAMRSSEFTGALMVKLSSAIVWCVRFHSQPRWELYEQGGSRIGFETFEQGERLIADLVERIRGRDGQVRVSEV